MTGLRRVACLIGSAVALFLSTGGCSDYSYFNVHVTLDPSIDDTTQRNIDSCVVYVFAGNEQIEGHKVLTNINGTAACRAPYTGTDDYHNDTNDIGTMDYSTARSSGSIRFFIDMESLDQKPSVQGSAQGNVNPGQVISLNLVAESCGTTCQDVSGYK
jgi:hypothetical protein